MTENALTITRCDLGGDCPTGGRHIAGSESLDKHNDLARGATPTVATDSLDLDSVILEVGDKFELPDFSAAMSLVDGVSMTNVAFGPQTSRLVLMRPPSLNGQMVATIAIWDPKPPAEADVCFGQGLFDIEDYGDGEGNLRRWALTDSGSMHLCGVVAERMREEGDPLPVVLHSASVTGRTFTPGVFLEFYTMVPAEYAGLPVGDILDSALLEWSNAVDGLVRPVHKTGVFPFYRAMGERAMRGDFTSLFSSR